MAGSALTEAFRLLLIVYIAAPMVEKRASTGWSPWPTKLLTLIDWFSGPKIWLGWLKACCCRLNLFSGFIDEAC